MKGNNITEETRENALKRKEKGWRRKNIRKKNTKEEWNGGRRKNKDNMYEKNIRKKMY